MQRNWLRTVATLRSANPFFGIYPGKKEIDMKLNTKVLGMVFKTGAAKPAERMNFVT